MADLDDFFAKKDRKKSKGKKFTTTEEIAKKLEETGKKVDKLKTKEKPANPEGGDDNQQIEEEDEWKEFEEEKKDYTGLKIGNLTVNEHEDHEGNDERGTGENSSDGESGEGGGKQSGPWRKQDAPAPAAPVQEPEPVAPQQPAPPTQPTTGGAYRIPQHRAGGPPPTERVIGRLRSHKNIAPDINNEEYFPTLNAKGPAANDSTGAWGRKKFNEGSFEEVKNRGAGRMYNAPDAQSQAPKLSLGNKYGALQDQS